MWTISQSVSFRFYWILQFWHANFFLSSLAYISEFNKKEVPIYLLIMILQCFPVCMSLGMHIYIWLVILGVIIFSFIWQFSLFGSATFASQFSNKTETVDQNEQLQQCISSEWKILKNQVWLFPHYSFYVELIIFQMFGETIWLLSKFSSSFDDILHLFGVGLGSKYNQNTFLFIYFEK